MRILQIEKLTKRYGKITAVDELTLQVESGMIFGLLGPNGSGKTTTLGAILGIIHPSGGQFQWFEGRKKNPRLSIGSLLETPNFYPYLNAIDNLKITAHIKRIAEPKIESLLKLVNLWHRKTSKFKTYSLGMKQRLAIAAAMIGDPEVLIFDEPTNGLDPQGIAEVRQTLQEIAETGKTIIMASHILDEVEKICSHVAIIQNGHLLATGPVGAIINDDVMVEVAADDLLQLEQLLAPLKEVRRLESDNKKLVLQLSEEMTARDINQLAFDNGILLTHLLTKQKSLEAEFLEITSNGGK